MQFCKSSDVSDSQSPIDGGNAAMMTSVCSMGATCNRRHLLCRFFMLEKSSDSTAGLNFTRNATIASTDESEEYANEIFLPVLIGWSLRVSRLAKLVMLKGRPVGACIKGATCYRRHLLCRLLISVKSSDSTAGLNFTRNATIASTDESEEYANEIFLPVLIGWSLRVSRLAKLVMLKGRPMGACITGATYSGFLLTRQALAVEQIQ